MKKILIIIGIALAITASVTVIVVRNNSTKDTDNTEYEISSSQQETSKKVSAEYYGKFVNYSIDLNGDRDNTNDWKIFYSDENTIFLISAGYVKSDSEYLRLDDAGMNRVCEFESNFLYEPYIYIM